MTDDIASHFNRVPGHVDRAVEKFACPSGERDWTVCRFVKKSDGTRYQGWPLRGVYYPCGWSERDPVYFFTHDKAIECANENNRGKPEDYIAFDVPVHISAIHWRVCLYSHYDGSKIEGETNDYGEAIRAFTAACGVAARENTDKVAYLKPELHGEVDAPPVGLLPSGTPALGPKTEDRLT